MISETYLLLTFLVLCWTLNPFIKKKASFKLSSGEYMIYNHLLCTLIVLAYFIYIAYQGDCDINCLKKLDKYEILYSILGAFTTVIASLTLIKLLKENQASDIIPYIQPLVILMTLIIGYFIFNETMTKEKIIGVLFIILGLYTLSLKK